MMRSSLAVGSTCVLLLVLAPGCSCSSPTLGGPCIDERDCDDGQLCDRVALICVADSDGGGGALDGGGGGAGTDSGAGDDGGAGSDGGDTDAAGSTDAGGGGTDAGPACFDVDGDGVSDCAGDCDDSDPFTFPGATEVCGDGVRNDCTGGTADAGCGGLGTYVSQSAGDDANDGTQADPVATIAEAIVHANTIGGGVDIFVAEGDYPGDHTMVEGRSFHGGYEPSGWTRDPTSYRTILRNSTHNGILFPSGITDITTLDGFEIVGSSGSGSTTAITVNAGASPVIQDNVVFAGAAGDVSTAIQLNPTDAANAGASPRVENNTIHLNSSRTGWGGGGSPAGSFGIRARFTNAQIIGNTINFAEARTVQRGIRFIGNPNTALIRSNTIRHPSGTADSTFAIYIRGGGAIIELNDVYAGRAANYGQGVVLDGDLEVVRVTNNVVFGADNASVWSFGLAIAFEARVPTGALDVLVHSNFLAGGSGSGTSAGVYMGEDPPSRVVVGRFFNNIIRSGTSTTRYGVWEQSANRDPELNPDAIGARVVLESPSGPPQVRRRVAGEGLLGSFDPRLLFGVPSADPVQLEITWPGGRVERRVGVAVDQEVVVRSE